MHGRSSGRIRLRRWGVVVPLVGGGMAGLGNCAWASDFSFFAPGTVEQMIGSGSTAAGGAWSGVLGEFGIGVPYVASAYTAPVTGRYTFLTTGRDVSYDRLLTVHTSSFNPNNATASLLQTSAIESSVAFSLTSPPNPYGVSVGADLVAGTSYRVVNSGYEIPTSSGVTDRGQYVNTVRYTPTPIAILDDSPLAPVSRTLSLSQNYVASSLTAVTVHGLSHTYMSDLVITLKRGATTVTLFNRAGEASDFLGGDVRFSAEGAAQNLLGTNSLVASANLAPQGSFSGLNNSSIGGDWTLEVADYFSGDVGSFTGFTLSFTLAEVSWAGNVSGTWTDNARWTGGVAPNVGGISVRFGNVITAARQVTVPSAVKAGVLTFDSAQGYGLVGAGTITMDSDSIQPAQIVVVNGNHSMGVPVILAGDTTVTVPAGRKLSLVQMLGGKNSLISVTGGGTLAVSSVVEGERLTISGGSFVDLGRGAAVMHGMTEAEVRQLVGMWWDSGQTTAVGLGSSVAGVVSGRDELATLAVTVNGNGSGGMLLANLGGVSLVTTDVLVKYTYLGDANLDGSVTAADLSRLLGGVRGHLTGWANGDFNYDGVVDGDDLADLMRSLRFQGASFGNEGGVMGGNVPEPGAAMGIWVVGVMGLGRRVRR